ncbi:protein translocase subunit SecD [Actinoplanes sp. M2I2]|uniref:protein translocase subunit SecD n=1 Tax=Actinoplanes sp. M2I2 TaxID=1734444 RepID=UPI002020F56A|nr:protein translocase subunit SecD [Actinoplanes sp. M2I2]
MHPGRQLAVLGAIFVVLYLLVFLAGGASGSFTDRLTPKLGLDLVGGTQATYIASVEGGQVPSKESMEQARGIIEERVNALGVSEAEVVIQGDRNIVVSLAGKADDQLKDLSQAAQMRFRMLVGTTGDVALVALNPPSAAPSAAPSAGASAPAGAQPSNGGSAPAVQNAPSSGGQGGGEVVKAPAPSATPSAPAPSPSASAEAPVSADTQQQRAAVQKKVGAAAWAAAEKLTAPVDLSTDTKAGLPFANFAKLTGEEVNALTPQMQFNVPTVGCRQLDDRPNGAIDRVDSQAVACYQSAKVLLDKAPVVGEDISTASPQLDQQTGQWVVSLDFTSAGSAKWAALTRQAFEATSSDPCFVAAQSLYGQVDHCAVAVVLDKNVISAPQIQGVLTGTSQITGQFTSASARQLADQLNFGALPVTFTSGPAQTVSATLGIQQLKAGLLAAAIGMGLVAIYAFFYYRLLGSVIFLSLILSGLLTFGALVFLGRTVGFTLTLAGIAGFIVSLGVAADSFVIYFERLKDEIHEGRSPRSAVPRAWARARRTIISANTITILAAVVLYIVSVGAVQGFAFALGISTVLDLVVVFLFRHPIMTMFARTKAFLSPRVSGLGRVLRNATTDPKEA